VLVIGPRQPEARLAGRVKSFMRFPRSRAMPRVQLSSVQNWLTIKPRLGMSRKFYKSIDLKMAIQSWLCPACRFGSSLHYTKVDLQNQCAPVLLPRLRDDKRRNEEMFQ
jgi:hypothetical protein